MKTYYLFLTALVGALLLAGCSNKQESHSALVKGDFSISEEIDSTQDLTGVGVTIVKNDSVDLPLDTLYREKTDSAGTFSGLATFPQKGEYSLYISRNGNNLGRTRVILAQNDTVHITGELSDLQNTFSIDSREHRAMEKYQRLERYFGRVAAFASAGQISVDSLDIELQNWSNLFWDLYRDEKGTIASRLAARRSITLLQGWNDSTMMKRIRSISGEDELAGVAATFGKEYLAKNKGLDRALGFLDTLQRNTGNRNSQKQIQMEQIKLLYDSARIEHAKTRLQDFKEQFSNDRSAGEWARTIDYDLNYLSPGDSIPSFSFTENGRNVSRDSMIGKPYILEISTLANRLYQEQFDRTVVIHGIYKNFGLQVITIPMDTSQVTVDAFFEQRVKPWPVADADDFDRQVLIERFNVKLVPTRFLVDRNGLIVRKYVGREFDDVIKGIQMIIKNEEPPS